MKVHIDTTALILVLLYAGVPAAHAQPTSVHDAVRAGDLAAAKRMVEADTSLLALKDTSGDTPLHMAAARGHVPIVQYLLVKGADLSAVNVESNTPLHVAIISGQDAAARLLVDAGADLTKRNTLGKTPLHLAVRHNRRDLVELLLAKKADLERGDNYQRTPLHEAARETGNAEIARLLMEKGANINAKDRDAELPLTLAAWKGFTAVIDALLDRGASYDTGGNREMLTLRAAADCGCVRLFRRMWNERADLSANEQANRTTMTRAVRGGSVEIVKLLLARNVPIATAANSYGWTPLHFVASRGHAEMVAFLAERGIDLNARTLSGKSAYNLAVDANQTAAVDALARLGASTAPARFPELKGPYLGQAPPGPEPAVFARDIVSGQEEFSNHSSLAASPDGTELYWGGGIQLRGAPGAFGGARYGIRVTRLQDGTWTAPQFASFSGVAEHHDDNPFVTPDNKRLFFTSMRPAAPGAPRKENIWFVERTATGWSEPRPVSAAVNAMQLHWQVSVARSGTLYFAGTGPEGPGIYASRLVNGEYTTPARLGTVINTGGPTTPYVAPDESYLVFSRMQEGQRLYVSFRSKDGEWLPPVPLGNGLAGVCPRVSPDGKRLFFLGEGVMWLDAEAIEALRAKTVFSATPPAEIHEAAKTGNLAAVRAILESDAGLVDAKDENGRTPLHWAARGAHIEVVRLLVTKGAPVDIAANDGATPFYLAARRGSRDVLEFLLAHGARKQDLERRDPYGRTPLCSAARDGGGDAAVVKTLIDLGADVNAADKFGWTPIELAAWRPYPAVVNVLLDAGANLMVNTPSGKRLLSLAANGLERLFDRMVKLGADLDVPTGAGGTLLYAAAGGGSRRILEILVARGFDVNARDRFGWVPLHVAVEQGRRENITFLLEKGADLNARNALGQTPFNLAVERDDPEMVEFLKSLGADASAPRFPVIAGPYLGRPRPGLTPEPFAPGIVSHRYEPHSTVAVSPAGDEIFWDPMIEARGGGYSYGYLVTTRLEGGRWTYPRKAAFSKREFGDDHPVFSADGKTLYFRSDRPAGASDSRSGPRVWSVTKSGNGWSEPVLRSELPVGTRPGMYFGFSFDEAGNYYYNDGPDIVVCRRIKNAYAPPEKLGPEINFGELRGIPYVSPKGDFLIFLCDLKLFVSFRKAGGGWGPAVSLAKLLGNAPNVSFTGPYVMVGRGNWVDRRAIDAFRPK